MWSSVHLKERLSIADGTLLSQSWFGLVYVRGGVELMGDFEGSPHLFSLPKQREGLKYYGGNYVSLLLEG